MTEKVLNKVNNDIFSYDASDNAFKMSRVKPTEIHHPSAGTGTSGQLLASTGSAWEWSDASKVYRHPDELYKIHTLPTSTANIAASAATGAHDVFTDTFTKTAGTHLYAEWHGYAYIAGSSTDEFALNLEIEDSINSALFKNTGRYYNTRWNHANGAGHRSIGGSQAALSSTEVDPNNANDTSVAVNENYSGTLTIKLIFTKNVSGVTIDTFDDNVYFKNGFLKIFETWAIGTPYVSSDSSITTTSGEVIISDALRINNELNLGNNNPGTAGQVLVSAGAGNLPTWGVGAAGSVSKDQIFKMHTFHHNTAVNFPVSQGDGYHTIFTSTFTKTAGTHLYAEAHFEATVGGYGYDQLATNLVILDGPWLAAPGTPTFQVTGKDFITKWDGGGVGAGHRSLGSSQPALSTKAPVGSNDTTVATNLNFSGNLTIQLQWYKNSSNFDDYVDFNHGYIKIFEIWSLGIPYTPSTTSITETNDEVIINPSLQINNELNLGANNPGTAGNVLVSAGADSVPTWFTNLHFGAPLSQDSTTLSNGRHVLKNFNFNTDSSTTSSSTLLDADGVFTAPKQCVLFITYQVLVRDNVPTQNVNEVSLYLQKGNSSGGAFIDVRTETVQLGSTGDTYIQHSLSLSSILTLAQNERFRCEVEVYSSGGDAILKALGTSMSCLGFEIPVPVSTSVSPFSTPYGVFSQPSAINSTTKNAYTTLTTFSEIQASGISISNGVVTLPSAGLYLYTGTVSFHSSDPSIYAAAVAVHDSNGNRLSDHYHQDTPNSDVISEFTLQFTKAIAVTDPSVTYHLKYFGGIYGSNNQLNIKGEWGAAPGGGDTTKWTWIKLADNSGGGFSTYGVFTQLNNITKTMNSWQTLDSLSEIQASGISISNGVVTLPSTGLYFFLGTIRFNTQNGNMQNYQVHVRDSVSNYHSVTQFNDSPQGDTLRARSAPLCGAIVHNNPSVTYYTEFRVRTADGTSDTLTLSGRDTEITWIKIGDPGGINTYGFFRLNGQINPATKNAATTLTTFSTVQANGISMSNGVITLPSTGVYYYTGYVQMGSSGSEALKYTQVIMIDNNSNIVSRHGFHEWTATDVLQVATQTFTNVIHCTDTSVTYRLQYNCGINGTPEAMINGNENTQMIWLKIA
jgi:hypothetical protein